MQISHDTKASQTPNPDEGRVRRGEFTATATFLAPRFRIAVAPRSGELQVRVELADVKTRGPSPATRH
ncbi:MAG: hypothetical protein ACOZQL_35495 [Myxococcota bacterium]